MASRELTTPLASASPEASSKTTGKSFMLSAEEREAIELRQIETLRRELKSDGLIPPSATDPTAE